MSKRNIAQDAVEFGNHAKQGGWRLGLLVARSVEKGKGNGQRGPAGGRKAFSTEKAFDKVSSAEFAKLSGTSPARVLRYLTAWDVAALDGLVPESALLVPGEELDGLDTMPDWSEFYDSNGADGGIDKRNQFTPYAEAEGTTTGKAMHVAKNKKALAAAIMADPEVERVAREAVIRKEDQRTATAQRKKITTDRRPDDGTVSQREVDAADAAFDSLIYKLRAMRKAGQEALSLALDIQGLDQGAKRALVAESVDGLRALLDAIAEAAQGRSMDDELQSLLSEES